MDARIRVNAQEFDEDLFKRIKLLLQDKEGFEVTISITRHADQKLDQAIRNVEHNHNLTYFTLSEYEDFKKQLLNEP
jgi:hypothetical protein